VGRWLSGGRTRLEGRHVLGVEQRQLDSALRAIRVKAWRLHMETPGVVATVPMLRGEIRCPAAHNAVGLAGESPAVGIDCLST